MVQQPVKQTFTPNKPVVSTATKPSFLQRIDKKKLGKGALIAGATVGAGLGAKYLYDKNKKKKAEREEKVAYYKQEIMEKVASYREW